MLTDDVIWRWRKTQVPVNTIKEQESCHLKNKNTLCFSNLFLECQHHRKSDNQRLVWEETMERSFRRRFPPLSLRNACLSRRIWRNERNANASEKEGLVRPGAYASESLCKCTQSAPVFSKAARFTRFSRANLVKLMVFWGYEKTLSPSTERPKKLYAITLFELVFW